MTEHSTPPSIAEFNLDRARDHLINQQNIQEGQTSQEKHYGFCAMCVPKKYKDETDLGLIQQQTVLIPVIALNIEEVYEGFDKNNEWAVLGVQSAEVLAAQLKLILDWSHQSGIPLENNPFAAADRALQNVQS